MIDFLEHLRRRPIEVRKRVAFVGAISVTVLIVIVWLGSFLMREPKSETHRAEETKGPTQALGANIGAFFHDITREFAGLKEKFTAAGETFTATTTVP